MLLLFVRPITLVRSLTPALQFCQSRWAQASARSDAQPFSTSTSINLPVASGDSEVLQKPLFGTVPSHHSSIFLHTPEPPVTFPAKSSTPVWRALQLKVSKWGGIVNFCWLGRRLGKTQSATAFSALGGRLEIPEITLENLDEVEEKLRKHVEGPLPETATEEIHLYVCTHGARDCRCGNIGGAVVNALRVEVEERMKRDPNRLLSRIKIGEVGHVGGHQFGGLFSTNERSST